MIRKTVKSIAQKVISNNYKTLNFIEIDSKKLLSNIGIVAKSSGGQKIFAVLKSNAYGHGLKQVAKILNDCPYVEFIAVDGYFEAAKTRDITKKKILVMGYILPENFDLLDTKRCSLVIQSSDDLLRLSKLNKAVNIHMELNSGMNRLGIHIEEIEDYLAVLSKYPKLHLEGVMTHLADADNEMDNSFTNDQVELFDAAVSKILKLGFKPQYIHIAQTAGSVKADSKYANAIRLGIGSYGINPLNNKDQMSTELAALKPVLELKSTIVKTIDLKKGDRVSYNGIYQAKGNERIGVLPLGYYEGLDRRLSNKAVLRAKGHNLPVRGRICMNHTMVDISGTDLQVGDQVTVVSNNSNDPNSINKLCLQFDLFSYELLTGLSESIRRYIV